MSELLNFKIETFTIADYAAAIELWKTMEGVSIIESDSEEAISAFLIRNPQMSFVAKTIENKMIGTILSGHNGRAGHIYHLAVAESHRGCGIGKKLVDLCLAKLKDEKIARCNIFVFNDNQIANRFWINSGWIDPTDWKVLQKII